LQRIAGKSSRKKYQKEKKTLFFAGSKQKIPNNQRQLLGEFMCRNNDSARNPS
jgi:hypothetical protein